MAIVTLPFKTPEQETAKAIMFNGAWYPKSQITIVRLTDKKGNTGLRICIPRWLAEKNGIKEKDHYKTIRYYYDIEHMIIRGRETGIKVEIV